MKKYTLVLIITLFMLLSSCGTLIKFKQVNKPVTKKLDYSILTLDIAGLFFFVAPGVIALSVDYLTGTLFLPFQPNSN